jgi:hypothetical protein
MEGFSCDLREGCAVRRGSIRVVALTVKERRTDVLFKGLSLYGPLPVGHLERIDYKEMMVGIDDLEISLGTVNDCGLANERIHAFNRVAS